MSPRSTLRYDGVTRLLDGEADVDAKLDLVYEELHGETTEFGFRVTKILMAMLRDNPKFFKVDDLPTSATLFENDAVLDELFTSRPSKLVPFLKRYVKEFPISIAHPTDGAIREMLAHNDEIERAEAKRAKRRRDEEDLAIV